MTSSCQDSGALLKFSCLATLNSSTPIVENREKEMLIIASIQTLERGNKKCGKIEVFMLFRDSVNSATKKVSKRLQSDYKV